MRTMALAGLFTAILTTTLFSCIPNARMYRQDNKKKIYTGQLSGADYAIIRQLLTINSKTALQDTLIIRYDYNYETCWNTLDQQGDEHITSFISFHQAKVQKFRELRPQVSLFEYKEPGKYLNKLKKWNTSIIVDSSKQLYKLLFSERTTCGSSIIILPNKDFVFVRSDPHFMAMDYTQEQIKAALNRK